MDEKKISPVKNILQRGLISKNKKFFLASLRPNQNLQASANFNELRANCYEKENEEEKLKIDKSNINNINNVSKNSLSYSTDKLFKNKKLHESNLKKIEELEKQLSELEIENNSLAKNIETLKDEENGLKGDLLEKDNEIEELNEELKNLKNINETKNREYLQLMNSRQQQEANRGIEFNNHTSPENMHNNSDNNTLNNSSERPNDESDPVSINEVINRLLNMYHPNGEQESGQMNMTPLRFPPLEQADLEQEQEQGQELENEEENEEELGPPMTFAQIEALPTGKYPRSEVEEKCVICEFDLCFNDVITKLSQCQHIFHKECLGNYLIQKQSSKCPICKVTLI